MLEKLEGLGLAPARLLVGLLTVVAVAVFGWWLLRPPPAPVEQQLPMAAPATTAGTPAASTTTGPTEVVVHVAGAVARPGVQRVAADRRVADVVDAAGGLSAEADPNRINLAAPLTDGMQVYVPKVGEEAPPVAAGSVPADGGAGSEGSGPDAPVNVNTAGADELDELPGVGPATAEAIIEHREANGPFTTVDQLLDVRGIGDAKLAELRDRVVL